MTFTARLFTTLFLTLSVFAQTKGVPPRRRQKPFR